MSTTETASGAKPSTALAVSWQMAATFCADSCAPGRSFTSTLALAGCARFQKDGVLGERDVHPGLLPLPPAT